MARLGIGLGRYRVRIRDVDRGFFHIATMQALKKPTRWSQWEEDDDELPELPWKKATSCTAPPDLGDENHAQAAFEAPVSTSPPVMK